MSNWQKFKELAQLTGWALYAAIDFIWTRDIITYQVRMNTIREESDRIHRDKK